MSSMTVRCKPNTQDWLEETLKDTLRTCPTMDFVELAPGVYRVVAVYAELVVLMERVVNHPGVFVSEYESRME